MTMIITLVGDLGGGKTTLAAFFVLVVKFLIPDAPVFSNVTVGGAITIGDLHKFLAIKLINKDRRYAFMLDDEAAQSGLESRGSGTKAAAIESRIITHARKANVDLVLISQLKSMLDKRAQWVENVSILCEAVFEEGNLSPAPDYFHYTVYGSDLEVIQEFDLDTEDMAKYVWPQMDTYDIPDFERFKQTFISYYDIAPGDEADFQKKMVLAAQYSRAEGLV